MNRTDFNARPHTPQGLDTKLTPAQGAVVVELRRLLLLPLDDLVAVVKEFIEPSASRFGIDRGLTRYSVNHLRTLRQEVPRPAHKPFKANEPEYLHNVNYLPQMPDATQALLPVRGHRPDRALGIRPNQAQQDSPLGCRLP